MTAKTEEIIFVCGCDCQSFHVHNSGAIECCNCGHYTTNHADEPGEWIKRLPPVPDVVERDERGTVVHNTMQVANFARYATVKAITEWHKTDNLALLAAFDRDGNGKHWTAVKTEEQKAWMIRQTEKFLDYLKSMKCTD